MLEDYPREIVTKDGAPVLIRPLVPQDEERLNQFFDSMGGEDFCFLRADIDNPEILHNWIREIDFSRVLPMIAVKAEDETIIALLRLYRRPTGAMPHVGHLRIIVAPAFRQQRLGTWMLLDMVRLAMDMGIEKLVAEFVSGVEDAAICAAAKLDFFEQARLKDYVKDQSGGYRDLIIMVKNLHREWSDF